jgi:hypothetical protein
VSDEVTITLRKSELRDMIVSLTAMLDQKRVPEQIADPLRLVNGYLRLCHQAQQAGVPILSDESIDEGIDKEAERCSSHIDCSEGGAA